MCLKPKTPEVKAPPPPPPQPTREEEAIMAERRGERRRSQQQGIFSNIRTSALGDTRYDTNTEMARFGAVGSVA